MSTTTQARRPLTTNGPVPESLASYPELMATRAPGVRTEQQTLAVEFPIPADDQWHAPQRTGSADLPDARAWAANIGQAIIEVVRGRRSPPQLIRWLTPDVYAQVAELALTTTRARRNGSVTPSPPARVRRVILCEPVDGVAEASLVVCDGPRVRAIALRLVGLDGRWRVEALSLG